MIFLTSDSVLKKDKNYYLLVYSSDKKASDASDKKGSYEEQIKYQMMNNLMMNKVLIWATIVIHWLTNHEASL